MLELDLVEVEFMESVQVSDMQAADYMTDVLWQCPRPLDAAS